MEPEPGRMSLAATSAEGLISTACQEMPGPCVDARTERYDVNQSMTEPLIP